MGWVCRVRVKRCLPRIGGHDARKVYALGRANSYSGAVGGGEHVCVSGGRAEGSL